MSKSSVAGGGTWAEPGCCSVVPRAVTNTGDRGYRPNPGNARGSRSSLRPATGRGHVVRFDNRDLVAHGGHPRQVRPVFLGFRGLFLLLHHVHRFQHTATRVVRLRVVRFLQFGKVPGESDAFAPGDTRVG